MSDLREDLTRELAGVPVRDVGLDAIEARTRRRVRRRRAGTVALVAVVTAGSLAFLTDAFDGQEPTPIQPGPIGEGWIVFDTVAWPDQPARIYRMQPDGSRPTPITDGEVDAMSPAVSPDGSTIAFVRVDDVDPPSTRHEGVYVMGADGTDVKEILRTGEPMPVSVRGLAWSPDGSRIAFVRGVDEAMNELWLMNADGSDARRLIDEPVGSFSWSPDGSRIAFAGTSLGDDRYRSDLFVMNADGSDARRLTDDGISWTPSWSPDGGSVAFTRWLDHGVTHVYRLSVADPGDVTPVWTGDGAFDSLAWSPDGGEIAIDVLFRDDPRCFVVSVPLDGSTPTPLLVSERPPPFGDAETSLCAGSLTWAPQLDVDG